MNPAIRKALVKAINCTFASLPQDVREELRGCWFWQIAPLRHQDGCTIAHTATNNVVTFDPDFVEALINAGDESSLEALVCHEIGHVLRNLRGLAGFDPDIEERAVNEWMEARGFRHDLQRLKRFSGYERC